MKNRILLLSSIIVSGAVFAQSPNKNLSKSNLGVTHMHAPLMETSYRLGVEESPSWTSKIYNDELGFVIMSEDFAGGITNGWTNTSLSSGQERWQYRGTSTTPNNTVGSQGAYASGTGPIESTTAANGFVIMDSDWWDNGGVANGNGQQSSANHQAALTSPQIDCSLYPQVLLTFESHLRNYQSFFYVVVTNDGFATQDTVWNGEDYYSVNEISPDVQFIKIHVSSVLGGQPAGQVRFLYASNTAANLPGYYYWQLDDIALTTPPDHDLSIGDVFFDGWGPFLSDYQFNNYYSQIPVRQASADTIVFGAAIANLGSTAQTNATMKATVTGAMNFSSQVTPFTFPAISYDSANVENGFSATAIGNYDVSFEVSADSTDDFPDDNIIEESFAVSERLYSRNDDVVSSGVYWGTGNYAIYTRFDVFTVDTISGVSLNLYYSSTNTNFQTAAGSVAEVGVYPVTGYDASGNIVVDFENPLNDGANVAQTYYTVVEGDQNTTVMVHFDNPVGIPAGVTEVIAGYAVSAGTIRTSTSAANPGFGNVWVDTQNSGTIAGWTNTTNPMINIETWTASLCTSTTIVIAVDADCDNVNSTATLTPIVTTTGSSNDFTYEWSTAETDNEIVVDAEGSYSITVTDGNFCTANYDFNITNTDINCNLSVGDIDASSFGFNVIPNPNNGTFNLVFNAEQNQEIEILVQSVKGEIVYQNNGSVSNGQMMDINLSGVASGVYMVKVIGANSASVERIVIQ